MRDIYKQDAEDVKFDETIYKKRPGSNGEFGIELVKKLPSEDEVRYIANKHKECLYYSMGFDVCKRKMDSINSKNFLACKDVLDAMYRCYTNNKEGTEYHKIRDEAKPYMKEFVQCAFSKNSVTENCFAHFEDSLRVLYRNPKIQFEDYIV